jgi:hypothetical protein
MSQPDTYPPNFYDVMSIEYSDDQRGVGPLEKGRKRRTKGQLLYVCNICDNFSIGHKQRAAIHVWTMHPPTITTSAVSSIERSVSNTTIRSSPAPSQRSIQSQQSIQRSLTSFIIPTVFTSSLRAVFNEDAYIRAVTALLTRHRMPFSAVEWTELQELCLSCNPAIVDQLIISRRTASRRIGNYYTKYKKIIKNSLQMASSPIHIASDLWTSPH